MAPIKYRIEPNPMTTPGSYKLRFIPQGINGYDEVAAGRECADKLCFSGKTIPRIIFQRSVPIYPEVFTGDRDNKQVIWFQAAWIDQINTITQMREEML